MDMCLRELTDRRIVCDVPVLEKIPTHARTHTHTCMEGKWYVNL